MQLSSKPDALLQLPTFPLFSPISVVGRETYENQLRPYEPYSDFDYTSQYVWSRSQENLVSMLNKNVVISMRGYMDGMQMLTFLGTNEVNATARVLFEYLKQQETYMPELYLIPEVTARRIQSPKLLVKEDRDNHDYILSTQQFMEISGRGFAHMRRKISLFTRHNEDKYKVITIDMFDESTQQSVRDLSYKWAFMGTEGSITAHEEIAAISRLLIDFAKLNALSNIYGLGLMIDGALEGFCIYEIQRDYAIIHFIKASLTYGGAVDFILLCTMRQIYKEHGVLYVNYEQDLGILGLRAAKMRCCPVTFLKKYTITQNHNY